MLKKAVFILLIIIVIVGVLSMLTTAEEYNYQMIENFNILNKLEFCRGFHFMRFLIFLQVINSFN